MEYVPFDIRQFRCIVYEQSIEGVKNLQEELEVIADIQYQSDKLTVGNFEEKRK